MVDLIIALLLNLRFELPTPITESHFCSTQHLYALHTFQRKIYIIFERLVAPTVREGKQQLQIDYIVFGQQLILKLGERTNISKPFCRYRFKLSNTYHQKFEKISQPNSSSGAFIRMTWSGFVRFPKAPTRYSRHRQIGGLHF